VSPDPEHPIVDVGQSVEERHALLEELQQMRPEEPGPPAPEGLTTDEPFAALQSEVLGANALGTSPFQQ
jgi:hypothetical protein